MLQLSLCIFLLFDYVDIFLCLDNQTQTVYDNTIGIYFLLSYISKILLCFGTNLKIYAFQNQSKKQDFQEKELLKTPAIEQEDDAY